MCIRDRGNFTIRAKMKCLPLPAIGGDDFSFGDLTMMFDIIAFDNAINNKCRACFALAPCTIATIHKHRARKKLITNFFATAATIYVCNLTLYSMNLLSSKIFTNLS